MALYLGKKRVAPSIQIKVPSMKAYFEAGGKCGSSAVTSFEGIIKYDDTSNITSMDSMFSDCYSLIAIPLLDTSKVTSMRQMFSSSRIPIIPHLDVSNVTNMDGIFTYCSQLEEIHMYGMKVDFYINSSTKFTREALVEILNNLATVTSTKTLTMGSRNLAKLTDEDKAIATGKGWTLA